jgi:hypothetical protein
MTPPSLFIPVNFVTVYLRVYIPNHFMVIKYLHSFEVMVTAWRYHPNTCYFVTILIYYCYWYNSIV